MSAQLKEAPVSDPMTRPIATYYYGAVRDAVQDYTRIGHASTIRGAIRAAVGHILDRKYSACHLYDMNNGGVRVGQVFRQGNKITIICVADLNLV